MLCKINAFDALSLSWYPSIDPSWLKDPYPITCLPINYSMPDSTRTWVEPRHSQLCQFVLLGRFGHSEPPLPPRYQRTEARCCPWYSPPATWGSTGRTSSLKVTNQRLGDETCRVHASEHCPIRKVSSTPLSTGAAEDEKHWFSCSWFYEK